MGVQGNATRRGVFVSKKIGCVTQGATKVCIIIALTVEKVALFSHMAKIMLMDLGLGVVYARGKYS